MTIIGDAYLVGTSHQSVQPGRPARILGVVSLGSTDWSEAKLCYEVLFTNREKKYVPLSDSANFELITQDQFDRGEFPKVKN